MKKLLPVILAALTVAICVSCQAQPRQRPLDIGPVTSGEGTVEFERRRLQGTWQLDRFEVVDSSGNNWVVKAQANLTYDEYGNLRVEGKLLEPLPGQKALAHPLLGYNGAIVIDPDRHQFRLMDTQSVGKIDPALGGAIATSNLRRYELTPNTLKIWYLAPDGKPTAVASFSR